MRWEWVIWLRHRERPLLVHIRELCTIPIYLLMEVDPYDAWRLLLDQLPNTEVSLFALSGT